MKDTVPYKQLSKEAQNFCLNLLVEANTLLKKWATCLGKRKIRIFRKMLFKSIRDPNVMLKMEEGIDSTQLAQFRQDCQVIIAIHNKKQAFLDGNTVEYAMFCGFSSMVRLHAQRCYKRTGESKGMSLEDYRTEGYIALLDSIYGYTNRKVGFGTFLWRALRNRMFACLNSNSLLGPLSDKDLLLLSRYKKASSTFNDHVTFDEIVEAIGLDAEQRKSLSAILTKVHVESQIGLSEVPKLSELSNDYTAFRRDIDHDSGTDSIAKMSIQSAIKNANLSDFERLVLETSMFPYHGWKADIARKHINPVTQKPYGRAGVGYILKNVHEKLRWELVA